MGLDLGAVHLVPPHSRFPAMEVGVKKAAPRTVVAGLVNGVPTDQMQNQMVDYSVTQNLPRCGANVLTG